MEGLGGGGGVPLDLTGLPDLSSGVPEASSREGESAEESLWKWRVSGSRGQSKLESRVKD